MIPLNSIGKYLVFSLIFSSQIVCAQYISANGQPFFSDISSQGEISPVDLPLKLGDINAVALNNSNYRVFGGSATASRFSETRIPYALFIPPNGNLQSIPLSFNHGEILSVALNDSQWGILGGGGEHMQYQFSGPAYAAFISLTDFPLQPIPLSLGIDYGIIQSVAINEANMGIIGGINDVEPYAYAAFVSCSGTSPTVITPIEIQSTSQNEVMEISKVAINNANTALICGISLNDFEVQLPFAAFVSGADTSPIAKPIQLDSEIRNLVIALNNSNVGIIGGEKITHSTPSLYAAIASLNNSTANATPLSLGNLNGRISSVALNDTPQALIGGRIYGDKGEQNPYAAIIISDISGYTVLPIELNIDSGSVNDVALNNQNYGIVVGDAYLSDSGQSSPFVVLISPSGNKTITYPQMNIDIAHAAINNIGQIVTGGQQNQFSFITQIPTDSLNGNSLTFANYINTYAADLIPIYLTAPFFDGTIDAAIQSAEPSRNALSTYTAANNLFYMSSALSNHLHIPVISNPKNHSAWFSAIGATSDNQPQKQSVAFKQVSGGAIIGWDTAIGSHTKMGMGTSYLFTKIKEESNAGKGHIDQENLFFYANVDQERFYVNGSILTGLFQTRQVRYISTGFEFNASSTPHGYQILPHLEMGIKIAAPKGTANSPFTLTPLIALDWANTWQKGYQEKGNGPYKIAQKAHYSSLLRLEASVRASKTLSSSTMNLTFQGKGGFVNTSSLDAGKMEASLLGSTGSFTLETLSTVRKLGLAQVSLTVQPKKSSLPTSTISYQGELGRDYQSHQFNAEIAWNF